MQRSLLSASEAFQDKKRLSVEGQNLTESHVFGAFYAVKTLKLPDCDKKNEPDALTVKEFNAGF